jgi:hypothetical protein
MLEDKALMILCRLRSEHFALLERYDPLKIINEFNKVPNDVPYHFMPKSIVDFWSKLEGEEETSSFGILSRTILLELILSFEKRSALLSYTDEIVKCYEATFSRILLSIEDETCDAYNSVNDLFIKDLALCRQHMFPAGIQIAEVSSGFPRSLMFCGGPKQFALFTAFLLQLGGNKPLYQIHIHKSEMADFNPAGRDRSYLRIAKMLEVHPEIKGMFGGSWFYDPALEEISPHLVYLRKKPQDNGAKIFFSGVNIHGGALAMSKTRRQLYNEGKYLPKSYILIWPRKQMIEWAKRQDQYTGFQ